MVLSSCPNCTYPERSSLKKPLVAPLFLHYWDCDPISGMPKHRQVSLGLAYPPEWWVGGTKEEASDYLAKPAFVSVWIDGP
jgi:hypothetical protein